MKYINFAILLITLITLMSLTNAYDDMNDDYVVKLVKNKEAMHQLWGCVTNKNKCDEFGAIAKKHITESLQDGCRECDATQKHYGHLIIKSLKEYPEMYEQFEKIYDPDRTLLQKLDNAVIKYE